MYSYMVYNENGNGVWYRDPKTVHNEHGPAVIFRTIIPGIVESKHVNKTWKLNGGYHRDNGPAAIWNVALMWSVHDKQHRLDGPSVLERNKKRKQWHLNGDGYRKNANYELIISILEED